MRIISTKAEFDQDKQEKFVRVELFDNELDVYREAMTWMDQNFSQIMNPKQKSEMDKMKQINKSKDDINRCWDMVNSG